jgi:malonyl-CoA O-methyltransferase
MDKKTITRNFSRYALLYDKYADIQKKAAAELLPKARKDDCESILELGCGTGNYTLLLRGRFKKARIKAVDICEKMISVAQDKLKEKGVEFLVADAEDLNLSQEFDLITSNACFQWFEYLEKALLRYKALLSEKGAISFSIFGPQTFFELNSSIKAVLGKTAIAVDGFMAKENVEKILLKNFRQTRIREVFYRNDFASLKDLLDKIKYTGTRGGGLENKIVFSRRLLREIEKAYLDKFRKVSATYQVFFCGGKS